jgi:high affinity Mn2+ porin
MSRKGRHGASYREEYKRYTCREAANFGGNCRKRSHAKRRFAPAVALFMMSGGGAAGADLLSKEAPAAAVVEPSAYSWNGFYAGGHLGYVWGNSNWTASQGDAPVASGSFSLSQGLDTFDESGSWFAGLQAGYNYMLPNRVVLGAEADVSFPAFPYPLSGLSIGGISAFSSRTLGPETYSENIFASGTVRARLGYAPGDWLYYGTGGLAWTSDQFTLTQLSTGNAPSAFQARLGWAAGAGIFKRHFKTASARALRIGSRAPDLC